MAYSHTLDLVQGDTLPVLTITIRDANKAAPGKVLDPDNSETWAKVNLTGGSAQLIIRAVGGTVVKETLNGALADPANGVVNFAFSAATLDDAGQLEAEIQYTDSGGGIQTVFDTIRIRVREQF
jgi:hypothetical protein